MTFYASNARLALLDADGKEIAEVNTDTAELLYGQKLDDAIERGDPIAFISPRAANVIRAGRQALAKKEQHKKRKRALSKLSKRNNRRKK